MNITELTVHELQEKIKNKELKIEQIVQAYIESIKEKEEKVDAFITLQLEEAICQGKKLDAEIANGKEISSLAGIPIGIKDIICTKGVRTTCGSKMLENFIAPYDATVIEKVNKEEMISLGKLNMDEFAMGSSNEHSYFKRTKNPWDLSRIPGGSSGGSAAAVAANMLPWALGTDTGGSIRQPAALCGIVGLKPTYGLVSRYGVIAYASSLDQVGVFTKDVEDCAMLLNVIAGKDEKDTTSVDVGEKDYTKSLNKDIKGLKIGVPKEFFGEGINEEVKQSLYTAIQEYKKLGAEVEEFSLDIAELASAHEII